MRVYFSKSGVSTTTYSVLFFGLSGPDALYTTGIDRDIGISSIFF
jgi:hypothetical protein